MWVYQEPEKETAEQEKSLIPSLPEETPYSIDEMGQERAGLKSIQHMEPETSRRKLSLPSRDCILLAAAYLLGTLMAGVLQALCDAAETETLTYYLNCWQNIFAAATPAQAIGLFGAELAVVAGAAAVILLLGLSAVGPLPVFLFIMLYGTGSGLVSAQFLAQLHGVQKGIFLLTAGLPAALASGALCLFGASALQVSSRIHAFSFGKGSGTLHTAGAQLLLGQFVLLTVSLCPLCGAATGLVCLMNRML